MVLNVCLIGAGPTGIATLKCLADYSDKIKVTCYEQTPHIGGTWIYTDRVGTDENGIPIHTSMYKNLTSNLPKCLMELEGLSMPKELPYFIQHSDFLKYLEEYCDLFDLKKFIQFKTKVCKVSPLVNSENTNKWIVIAMMFDDDITKESTFDAVIVCNGINSTPYMPEIPGLDTFSGKWIHSRDYRIPETYNGKTVMCVGGFLSGQEIALQLISCAKKVYMSHRRTIANFTEKVYQVSIITSIEGNKLMLSDQSEIYDIDFLIFCTGYNYSFDFLDKSCYPHIDSEKKITPLYQHIVHVQYPALFFLGLPTLNPPIKTAIVQAKYVTSILIGRTELPTKDEMYKNIEFLYEREEGYPNPYYRPLCIFHSQWDYYAELSNMGKFDNLPPVIEKIYKTHANRFLEDFKKGRKYVYHIIDDDNFLDTHIE